MSSGTTTAIAVSAPRPMVASGDERQTSDSARGVWVKLSRSRVNTARKPVLAGGALVASGAWGFGLAVGVPAMATSAQDLHGLPDAPDLAQVGGDVAQVGHLGVAREARRALDLRRADAFFQLERLGRH